MKKLPLFLLLVLTVIISCTNPSMQGDIKSVNSLQSSSSNVFFVFPNKKAEENIKWFVNYSEEIDNEIPFIERHEKAFMRAYGHVHIMTWTGEYVDVHKIEYGIHKVLRYEFGYCFCTNCDYAAMRLIFVYFLD